MTAPDTVMVLETARSLIENPRHWWRRQYRHELADGEVAYCAIGATGGAVSIIAGDRTDSQYLMNLNWFRTNAIHHLGLAVPKGYASVVSPDNNHHLVMMYNDNLRTTHADILALYDKAIELATETA